MQIITTAIIKGGAGKTTTAAAIAQAAAAAGKRVLAIDLDPQGNLSAFIGADTGQPGSYQLITQGSAAGTIQATDQGIDAIAASQDLATIQTRPGSARRLQKALEPLKGEYDYIVIDTPPQIGELTFNALQASTGLLIPLETDTSSLQGLYQIIDIAEQMQASNPDLSVLGFLVTRYDSRSKLNRYLLDTIKDKGSATGAQFLLAVRAGIAIREAQAMQESLFNYAPGSKPAQDYKALFEIIDNH